MKSNELFGDFTVKALTNIIFKQETLGTGRTQKLKKICFMKSNELFGDFTLKALTNIIFKQDSRRFIEML